MGSFLAGDELDVVDEENVEGAMLVAEVENAVVTDRIDKIVHELFRGDINEL